MKNNTTSHDSFCLMSNIVTVCPCFENIDKCILLTHKLMSHRTDLIQSNTGIDFS